MKIPKKPPELVVVLEELVKEDRAAWLEVVTGASPVDPKGRYLHWDELCRRTPPGELSHEQWWLGMAIARQAARRPLPLKSVDGELFAYSSIDRIHEAVHLIDQQASGQIMSGEVVTSAGSSDRYLVSSLIEEAITSSQLEGASTTRKVAKQLLQSGRRPRDRSEQMILNNYVAMTAAAALAQGEAPLTVDDVLALHRLVTDGAIDDPTDAGRIQKGGEERIAIRWSDGKTLHQPPHADELPERLVAMCQFANGELDDGFIHPVVRAIILHFWLAYDHPFVDGNGRTSRALFYWSMLRSGYWLTQYISISSILRKAPAKYAMSYLHVETDGNDMTYFILDQLSVIQQAIESLRGYLDRKVDETRQVEAQMRGSNRLNHRQRTIVGDALREPGQAFTIKAQSRIHGVAYQSARTDLLELEELGLFRKQKDGKKFVFYAVADLAELLERLV